MKAIPRYGASEVSSLIDTTDGGSHRSWDAEFKSRSPPTYGAMVDPKELNACVRFNRLEAVLAGPRTET